MTEVIFKSRRRKITIKHDGSYGKPSRTGMGTTAQNKRACAAANIDRHRTKKGITLSILGPLKSESDDD